MVFNLPFAEVKDVAKQGGIVCCSVLPDLKHLRTYMAILDSIEMILPVLAHADRILAALKSCPS